MEQSFSSDTRCEVRTAAGIVRGRFERGVAVFRGIPYAEPPVGVRRFMPPVSVVGWEGVRDAVAFGPRVPQAGNRGSVMDSVSGCVGDGSGDCLTLNVWSPDLGAVNMPVMVWIQGGTYLENDSGNPHCDGAGLAAAGVVVVSMNYRVGMDGFGRIAGVPDNRGILDQVAALRWVRENIAGFGGDPGNVTVFGQSAGGACIAALLVMPLAAGLFRRAIIQSMAGTCFSPRLAGAVSDAIAGRLGVRATVAELAELTPRALIEASGAVLAGMPARLREWGPMALTPTPFSPVVDGEVLPCAPWRGIAEGAARGVDVLIGHTRDESRLYMSRPAGELTEARVAAAFDHLSPGSDGRAVYRDAYPAATVSERFEILHSDWLFRMPALHLAEAAHAGGGPVWMYELAWGFNAAQGSSHCLDFLLVFGTLGPDEVRAHPRAYPDAAAEIGEVARRMRGDWVRFAADARPGWPRFDRRARTTRVYDAESITRAYPEEASRRIWSGHRFGTLDLRPG
ncbi:carboxylesterase/lipase family protein [Nocardia yamanashiensis]|uniref:carboxylesterase/lipase family protein n=1 Tax=Nocardia yamanashiensis TaxID=209247 RepID=UPI002FCE2886